MLAFALIVLGLIVYGVIRHEIDKVEISFGKMNLLVGLAGNSISETRQPEKGLGVQADEIIIGKRKDVQHLLLSESALSETEVRAFLYRYSKYATEYRNSLSGLHNVMVLVELRGSEIERHGLTTKVLQTAVELQLRQQGIRVDPNGLPLYVCVTAIPDEKTGIFAIFIEVQFSQPAVLLKNPKTRTYATTWQHAHVWLAGLNKLGIVRESVQDLVNEFINDYLAANPKEPPVKEQDKKPKDD